MRLHAGLTEAGPATRCRVLIAGFGLPGMRDLDFGRQFVGQDGFAQASSLGQAWGGLRGRAACPPSISRHYSSVQPQELTSRTMTPRPVSMWVVQGMQGSKLRTARRTSMPFTWSSGTDSSSGVSTTACS